MSQSEAHNALRIEMTPNLRGSLQRAMASAAAQLHRHVTLEHLLLALADDRDAAVILEASSVDAASVIADAADYLGRLEDRFPPGNSAQPVPGKDVQHILQSASAAAQKGNRHSIGSALVLAAIVGDGRSPAAQILRNRGMTFENAIAALKQANAAQSANANEFANANESANTNQPAEANRSTEAAQSVATEEPAAPQLAATKQPGDHSRQDQPSPGQPVSQAVEPQPGTDTNPRLQNMQAAQDIIASARERIAAARSGGATARPAEQTPQPEPPFEPATAPVPSQEDSIGQDIGTQAARPATDSASPQGRQSQQTLAPDATTVATTGQPPAAQQSVRRGATDPQPAPLHGPKEEASTHRQEPIIDLSKAAPVQRPLEPRPEPIPDPAQTRAPRAPAPAPPPRARSEQPTVSAAAPTGPQPMQQRHMGVPPSEARRPVAPSPPPPAANRPDSPHYRNPPPPYPVPVDHPHPTRPPHAPLPHGAYPPSRNITPPELARRPQHPSQLTPQMPASPRGPHQETGRPASWPSPPVPAPAGVGAAPEYVANPAPARRPLPNVAPIEPEKLAQFIPRRMCRGVPATVEIRAPRARLEAWSGGDQGRRDEQIITKAMVMRLKAPDGQFTVEIASPETQWSEGLPGPLSDDVVSWRWVVTPTRRGRHPLLLQASTRVVGRDGLAAERSLPDQQVTVRVAPNYLRVAGNLAVWIAIACIGTALGYYGEGLFDMGRSMIAQVIR